MSSRFSVENIINEVTLESYDFEPMSDLCLGSDKAVSYKRDMVRVPREVTLWDDEEDISVMIYTDREGVVSVSQKLSLARLSSLSLLDVVKSNNELLKKFKSIAKQYGEDGPDDIEDLTISGIIVNEDSEIFIVFYGDDFDDEYAIKLDDKIKFVEIVSIDDIY